MCMCNNPTAIIIEREEVEMSDSKCRTCKNYIYTHIVAENSVAGRVVCGCSAIGMTVDDMTYSNQAVNFATYDENKMRIYPRVQECTHYKNMWS